ncbi:MAG: glutathione S-transferase [Gammaproteobacteria bacterium]|nr:glutathione S-transferase [Gammaproteobacteria bacterium]
MKLYDFEYSGNCYKIRLLLSMLGLSYQREPIDMLAQQQKSPEFLRLHPKGELPVLEDAGTVIRDSNAIMVYLASRYAPDWYPHDPKTQADVQYWLSTAANEVHHGLAAARAHKVFGFARNYAEAALKAQATLTLLDRHLAEHTWLVVDRVTIADVAMYPYAALAEQGEILLAPYRHVRAWFERIEKLSGYLPFPVYPHAGVQK